MDLNLEKLQESLRSTIQADADALVEQASPGETTAALLEQLKAKYGQTVTPEDIEIASSDASVWFDVKFIDPHGRVADLLHEMHQQSKDYGGWNGESFCQQVAVSGMETEELGALAAKYKQNVQKLVTTANEATLAALQSAATSIDQQLADKVSKAEAQKQAAEERAKERARLAKRPDIAVVAVKHGLKVKKLGPD